MADSIVMDRFLCIIKNSDNFYFKSEMIFIPMFSSIGYEFFSFNVKLDWNGEYKLVNMAPVHNIVLKMVQLLTLP